MEGESSTELNLYARFRVVSHLLVQREDAVGRDCAAEMKRSFALSVVAPEANRKMRSAPNCYTPHRL